jgi:selenocysteine lyase/cysteine desulfurase
VIDVHRARAETPGCEHVVHLNNAGSALMPQPVLDAAVGHLELEARIGGYEAYDANAEAVDRFYGATAELIGAAPEEIAFVSSATRAWDMAFYSFRFEGATGSSPRSPTTSATTSPFSRPPSAPAWRW